MVSSNGNIFRVTSLCEGNSAVTDEFPSHKAWVTQSFDVVFDLCLNKRWVNNQDSGDLRWHQAHYDVIVMSGSVM